MHHEKWSDGGVLKDTDLEIAGTSADLLQDRIDGISRGQQSGLVSQKAFPRRGDVSHVQEAATARSSSVRSSR